jgi:hypothetical protein
MIYKKTLNKIVLLYLLITLNTGMALSQSDLFEQGYVILNDGDTLIGYVKDPVERENLYVSVIYSDNQAGENPVSYTPYEVDEYYYEPGFCFVSWDKDLPDDLGKIFLQCLVKGFASIYLYELDQKQVFFLEKGDGSTVFIEKGSSTDVMDHSTREVLKNFLSDCSDLTTKVDNLQFKAEDLIKLIKHYNRCSNASREMIIYKLGKERVFRVGVTTGINLTDLQVHAPIPYQDMNLKTGLGFNIGLGLEFYFLNRLTANVQAVWASYNASLWNQSMPNDTAVRKDDVLFNFSYMDFPVKLKVNLSNNRIKTFLFGGLWYGVLVEQDIASQSTIPEESKTFTLDLDKLKKGYTSGFGVAIPSSRRSEISFEIGYIYQKAKTGNSDGLTLQNFYLQISYLF